MIESKESKTRDIPVWLTALVVLLCLGGGGLLIRWYMKEQPRQVVEVPPEKQGPAMNAGGMWRPRGNNNNGGGNGFINRPRDTNADGIQPWSRNTFRVKTGDTILMVNYSGSRVDISPQYHQTVRTPEEAELAVMRMSILQDPNWREYLNVTEEQLARLRKVPPPKSMTISDADRANLLKLWKLYHDGSSERKAAAEKDLLAALDEVGKKNLTTTKQYEAERADQIRQALTADQIKMYRESGGKTPTPKPAAIPAARPAVEKTGGATSTTSTPETKPARAPAK